MQLFSTMHAILSCVQEIIRIILTCTVSLGACMKAEQGIRIHKFSFTVYSKPQSLLLHESFTHVVAHITNHWPILLTTGCYAVVTC